eukprot:526025-Ditylum_brightwellii.AAC.1
MVKGRDSNLDENNFANKFGTAVEETFASKHFEGYAFEGFHAVNGTEDCFALELILDGSDLG